MIKEAKTGVYVYNDGNDKKDCTFSFYVDLTYSKKLKFVNEVVGTVVQNGTYNKVILNLIFDYAIINIFTDVDTTEIKESSNVIDSIEDFLEYTNIVSIVRENAKEGLMIELFDAVMADIEYKTGIHANPIYDAISNFINTINDKVAGIDTDAIVNFAKLFNEGTGQLTPERMLEAYANTDYLKDKIAHDLANKHKNDSAVNTLVEDKRIESN